MALTILMIHDKGPRGGGTRVQFERANDAIRHAPLNIKHLRLGRHSDEGEDTFPSTFWPHQGLSRRSDFLRKVADFKPDVVHVHGSTSSLSGILIRAVARRWPVVATLHDVGLFCMTGLRVFGGSDGDICTRRAGITCWTSGCWRPEDGLAGAAVAVVRLGAKNSQRRVWLSMERITVPSEYLAGLAREHGVAHEKLIVVPNICSVSDVPPLSIGARPHMLFVGTLSRDKGADLALDALAKLPSKEWTATFVGDGPARATLESRARELGLQDVSFVGWQDGERLARFREQSTIGMFPSRVVESFGLSGVESLAAGRPVVGIARGGVSEWLIDGETGLAASDLTPEALARRLAELAFDGARARKLGEQGRRLVATRFSPEVHRQLMLSVYSDAAGRRSGTGARCVTG